MSAVSPHVVSLTFDDALDTHLDAGIPWLEEHGFRGTFYVSLNSPSFTGRLHEWQQAAGRGHELGNHTLFHPAWRSKSYVTDGNAIEDYTLDRMRLELETANRLLAGLDGQEERTFAYPCCNTILGAPGAGKRLLRLLSVDRTRLMTFLRRHPWMDLGSTEISYEALAGELFLAARAGGNRFSAGTDFPPRRTAVPCLMLDGRSRKEIEDVLDAFTRTERGWLVCAVHGIGGGSPLFCEASVFKWLLETLAARSIAVCTMRAATRSFYERGHA